MVFRILGWIRFVLIATLPLCLLALGLALEAHHVVGPGNRSPDEPSRASAWQAYGEHVQACRADPDPSCTDYEAGRGEWAIPETE